LVKLAAASRQSHQRLSVRTASLDHVHIDGHSRHVVKLRDHKTAKAVELRRHIEGCVEVSHERIPRRTERHVSHWSTPRLRGSPEDSTALLRWTDWSAATDVRLRSARHQRTCRPSASEIALRWLPTCEEWLLSLDC